MHLVSLISTEPAYVCRTPQFFIHRVIAFYSSISIAVIIRRFPFRTKRNAITNIKYGLTDDDSR